MKKLIPGFQLSRGHAGAFSPLWQEPREGRLIRLVRLLIGFDFGLEEINICWVCISLWTLDEKLKVY